MDVKDGFRSPFQSVAIVFAYSSHRLPLRLPCALLVQRNCILRWFTIWWTFSIKRGPSLSSRNEAVHNPAD